MRTLPIAVTLGLAQLAQAQATPDDRLFWTANRRLSFTDFAGEPQKADTAVTTTAAGKQTHRLGAIDKSIDISYQTAAGKTRFLIRAGMKRNSSWIRDRRDSVTLAHEQGHFDICELYARMLRRDIRKARSLREARQLFDEAVAAEEREHNRYDDENSFEGGGINSTWAEGLRSRLKALTAFAGPAVIVKIDR